MPEPLGRHLAADGARLMAVPFEAAGFLTESIDILAEPSGSPLDERGNQTGWFVKTTVLGRVELGPVTPGGAPIPSRAFVPAGTDVNPGDRIQWEGMPSLTFDIKSVRPRNAPGLGTLFISLEIG